MARHIVRNVRIGEVSFCPEGIQKQARIALLKAKATRESPEARLERFAPAMPKDLREALRTGLAKAKPQAADALHAALAKAAPLWEPPTFDEIEARRVAEQAATEMRERMDSLRDALMQVVYSPELPDREARISESVDQFVAALEADLSALLQGRLAKGHTAQRPDKEGPMPAKLDKSKLPDDVKAHLEEVEGKLAKVETDLAKAQGDAKAAGERADKAEADVAELRKAKAVDPDSDEGFAELVKGMPAAQAEFLKAERAKRKALESDVAKMRDTARASEFLAKAKDYRHVPGKPEELAEALRKADDAGVLEVVERVLKAADAALEKAGLTKPIGSDQGGAGDDPMAKVEAAAGELRKANPKLTREQAIAKAIEENPDLYRAYLAAHPEQTRGHAH